jgi:hypothetical protein
MTSVIAVIFLIVCVSGLSYIVITEDLFLAREEVIGQRYPMVVVFWAWFFGGVWLATNRHRYLALFIMGSMFCLLSLTRAAYVQWILCGVVMLLAATKGSTGRKIGYFALIGIVALVLDAYIDFYQEILIDRFNFFSPDLATTDDSTRIRLAVWERLLGHLFDYPFHMIFGYGQMGASNLIFDYADYAGFTVLSSSAHSQYIDAVFRMGFPGLILEVLIGVTIAAVPLLRRDTPLQLRIVAACLAGQLGYGAFHESVRWHIFGITFWFFAGVISQHLERVSARAPEPDRAFRVAALRRSA